MSRAEKGWLVSGSVGGGGTSVNTHGHFRVCVIGSPFTPFRLLMMMSFNSIKSCGSDSCLCHVNKLNSVRQWMDSGSSVRPRVSDHSINDIS